MELWESTEGASLGHEATQLPFPIHVPFSPILSIHTRFCKNRRVKKRLINHHFQVYHASHASMVSLKQVGYGREIYHHIMTAMLLAMPTPTLAWLVCPNLLANTALLSKRQANG